MPRMFNFSLRPSGDKSFSEAIIDQMCQDLASESDDIMVQAKNALGRMQSYEGCLQLIQKTIREPNNEELKTELAAKLVPNVSTIRSLYELAIDVETIFAALIQISSQKSTKKAAGFLMDKIASLVEFAVSFDSIKSKTPDIQNDLSHFRRFIAVNSAVSNQLESLADAPLNAMSFFVADHCPMLKVLVRAIECAMTKEPAAVDVSAVLANSRCSCLSGSRPKDGRPLMNYLRAMTGAIILYDHTAVHGAFSSRSEVKIKRCVKELVQWKQNAHGATSELLDAIKYCSPHYNDSSTPEKIRTLMENRRRPLARMRLVIDTDAGVDDAVAILMALHAFPGDQVVGITTVFGNVDLHQANHNVKHILEGAKRTNIPIYSGASKAMVASVNYKKWAGHGPDGLGGESGIVEASLAIARRNEAVHALIDLAHKYSGELVIAAVGPLTNIALAILLDPDFMSNIKQLVVMGGLSRGEGNHTAHSEFNVSCDPEATDIVYQHCSAKKLYVVPFETCLDNALPWETFDRIFHEEANAHGEYVKKIWKFTRSFCEHEGFFPCDAYAIAILLHPEYIKTAPALKGRIHLAPDEKRGACIWDKDCSLEEANVTLVTEIDNRIFEDLLHHLAA